MCRGRKSNKKNLLVTHWEYAVLPHMVGGRCFNSMLFIGTMSDRGVPSSLVRHKDITK